MAFFIFYLTNFNSFSYSIHFFDCLCSYSFMAHNKFLSEMSRYGMYAYFEAKNLTVKANSNNFAVPSN